MCTEGGHRLGEWRYRGTVCFDDGKPRLSSAVWRPCARGTGLSHARQSSRDLKLNISETQSKKRDQQRKSHFLSDVCLIETIGIMINNAATHQPFFHFDSE